MRETYTGRLAPSPTGLLHLGHAATFAVAHRRARAAGGGLMLRIDDLDPQRSRARFVDACKEDLLWLGLDWDAEVFQSRRLDLYRAAMRRLLEQGRVYPCTCSRKDLQQAIQAPHDDTDDEPVYSGRCRREQTGLPSELQPLTNYRFRVPDHERIAFLDGNFGPQSFTAGVDFGDFLVWRKDGLPSYQLACVADDADLQISEVVRGRDLLKSTARQILLQRALDLPTPRFFHTELFRDEAGERLAKRHDALSVRAMRARGLSPREVLAMNDSREQAAAHHKA